MRPRVWFGWLFRETQIGKIEEIEEDESQGTLDSFEEEIQLEEKRQRELERLERMDVDMEMIEEAESQRGDWISRDKAELERKLKERQGQTREWTIRSTSSKYGKFGVKC